MVEALNGPLTSGAQLTVSTSETQPDQDIVRPKKKSKRRGSRDKEKRVSSATSVPPPVEDPLPPIPSSPQPIIQSLCKLNKRKESISIDIDAGESFSDNLDLVQEELNRTSLVEDNNEPEATTEDELLKDEKEKAAVEAAERAVVVPRAEAEEDCDESETCSVVSLRQQHQSLVSSAAAVTSSVTPPTPRSPDSARSSQQSADSVNSSKQLLSSNNSPKAQVKKNENS